jgi:peptidoglycan/LPS O-acetylase OafA/YrhL
MVRETTRLAVVPSSGRRLPGVEGLRALAALSILVVHTWTEAAPHGRPDFGRIGTHLNDLSFGVTLFFTLSGFLLYRPFARAIVNGRARPSFARYLRNRALRILPAYWVILFVCALLVGTLFVRGPGGVLEHHRLTDPGLLARAALFVQNYQPSTFTTGIGPAWSLAVEVVFYLALPLLVMLAWRLAATRRLRGRVAAALVPSALLLLVGLAGKGIAAYALPVDHFWQGWDANWHSVVEKSFVGQADLFAFGMALAVVHALWERKSLRLPPWWRVAAAGMILASYLVTARVSYTEEQLSYSPYNTLIAFACSLLLALVVLTPPQEQSVLVRMLETRPLVIAGVISYSIFLWHDPLILFLRDHGLTFDGPGGFFLNVLMVAAITAALSFLTYRLVEAPALRLKLRGESRREKDSVPVGQIQAAP